MGKNAIVGQSGGPTSVINASLAGVFESCKSRGAQVVYGMCNGVAGLLEERVVDLGKLLTDDLDIELLKRTPQHDMATIRLSRGRRHLQTLLEHLLYGTDLLINLPGSDGGRSFLGCHRRYLQIFVLYFVIDAR